jgi:hypothetical protein
MEFKIKFWVTSIIFLLAGVLIGTQIRNVPVNEDIIVPYIVQPECVGALSNILSEQAVIYDAASVMDFAPDVNKVVIFTGTESQYVNWVNVANENFNNCNRNTFTSFNIKKHVSPELQQQLAKSHAKNILIDGELITVYFSNGVM